MFNSFADIGFYDVFEKYKKLALKIIIGIVILVLIIVGINIFSSNNNQYHKLEQTLIDSAKKYESDKNEFKTQYIDAYTLKQQGYLDSLVNEVGFECNQASGVLVSINEGKKTYTPYLVCGEYLSSSITKIVDNDNKKIQLLGNKVITINVNDQYQEAGYKSDYDIETNGFVETTPGIYAVEYIMFDNEEKIDSVKRLVIVSNAPSQADTPTSSSRGLYLYLNGQKEITIPRGGTYEELGAIAKDTEDGDISNKIEILGTVETTEIGEYNLTYSIRNTRGTKVTIVRKVLVAAAPANITFTTSTSTTGYTSGKVNILINITSGDYRYTYLPNGTRTYSRTIVYPVASNGSYEFILHDINDNTKKAKVTVNNIYKGKPTGSCIADVRNGKTTVTVTPYTNSIYIVGYKYSINGTETDYLNSATYSANRQATSVRVTIKDIVGNVGFTLCTITGDGATVTTSKPIEPESGANIIAKASSNTLKVWVEEKQGLAGSSGTSPITYYQTRIWVSDPVAQIKKAVTPNWGSGLQKIKDMLDQKVSSDNLINKIVVGINGSGFYKAGTWNPPADKYNLTTEGPLVITNGTIIRNWYQDAYNFNYIQGVDSTGTLRVFPNPTSISVEERSQLFNTIINSGIKNTFTFRAPIVVLNGKLYEQMGSFRNDNNIRQAWCQIDKNNFVILTNKYVSPRVGFNGQQQADLFLALGCKTAINMDGGGSTSLYFKNSGASTGSIVVNSGSRTIGDALYFTEK